MSNSLRRLEHVRLLQERMRKVELSIEADRLLNLEQSSIESIEKARRSRSNWFRSIHEESAEEQGGFKEENGDRSDTKRNPDAANRLVEEAAWELAMAECDRVAKERPEQEALVAHAREEFLACRRERLEVETLVAEAEAVVLLNRQRREQRMLDAWFQFESRRRGSRKKR